MPGFALEAAQSYDARYLADWPAELYDVSMADASLEARSQAFARLRAELPARLAPMHVTGTSSANLTIDSFKLVLLPVWLTEIEADSRRGLVLINGETGAVAGEAFKKSSRSQNGILTWLRDLIND